MNIRHKILREEREPDENIPLKVPKLANLNYVLFRDTCVRETCTKKKQVYNAYGYYNLSFKKVLLRKDL